jgi:predicted PurR-regulated permease PerM
MKDNKLIIALLGVIALIATGVVLKAAQSVIIPFVIAWLLSYLLSPTIEFLHRLKVPRPLAMFITIVLLFGVGYLAFIFLYARLATFAAAFPRYQVRFVEITQDISNRVNLPYNPFADINWARTISGMVVSVSSSLVSILSSMVMVMIILVFMLLGQPYIGYKIKKALAPDEANRFSGIVASVSSQITRYLAVQFMISSITGVLVWLTLKIIGVDFAATWGAFAFFFNFIPTIGSIIASVPPILLAIVQFYPNIGPALLTTAAILVIQMGMGNGVGPKVMGDKLNLSPVVVLVSLLFWGWLWGIVGAILSIPIASTIKIVCESVEELHPISIMMGSGKAFAKQQED